MNRQFNLQLYEGNLSSGILIVFTLHVSDNFKSVYLYYCSKLIYISLDLGLHMHSVYVYYSFIFSMNGAQNTHVLWGFHFSFTAGQKILDTEHSITFVLYQMC